MFIMYKVWLNKNITVIIILFPVVVFRNDWFQPYERTCVMIPDCFLWHKFWNLNYFVLGCLLWRVYGHAGVRRYCSSGRSHYHDSAREQKRQIARHHRRSRTDRNPPSFVGKRQLDVKRSLPIACIVTW